MRWACPPRGRMLQLLLLKLEASLIGSCCIYQGEELALPDVRDIAIEDLKDPWGIEFAPAFMGRDTCRTPMVWRGTQPNGVFPMPTARGCRSHRSIWNGCPRYGGA